MKASRTLAAMLVSFGFLFITFGWVLAQTERGKTQWRVYAGNDSSILAPNGFEERGKGARFALECEGNPGVFSIVVLTDLDPPPWGFDFEGIRLGSLRIEGEPSWPVDWRSAGRIGIETALFEPDVEALMSSAGALEIQIEVPGEGAFHHAFGPSESIATIIPEFLETCRHHVRTTDLQFEVDGIEMILQIEVDTQDIEDIRELARELGIHDIERIWIGFTGASSLVAEVRGRETKSKNKIVRLTLELGNKRWRKSLVNQDDEAVFRGDWYTSTRYLDEFRRWVVNDRNWSINVAVGANVSYNVTKRIIAAIRAGRLVDGRDPNEWSTQFFTLPSPWLLESPDADGRPWVGRAQGEIADDDACHLGCYDVQFLSGKTITVRLVDDIVEVVRIVISSH